MDFEFKEGRSFSAFEKTMHILVTLDEAVVFLLYAQRLFGESK